MKRLIPALMLLMAACAPATPVNAVVMEAKVREVRFPSFSLVDVTLSEGIDTLQKRTNEFIAETNPPASEPLEIILVPASAITGPEGNHPPATVSYDGKNVTLETVLREIARSTRRDVFLTSAGVVIVPKGLPPFPNPEQEKGEIFRKLTGDGPD